MPIVVNTFTGKMFLQAFVCFNEVHFADIIKVILWAFVCFKIQTPGNSSLLTSHSMLIYKV